MSLPFRPSPLLSASSTLFSLSLFSKFDIVPPMNRSAFRSVFFILGGIFLAACEPKSQGPVVAHVAGMDITLDDLRARIHETPAAYQQYVASAEGRKQFLN